MRDHILAKVIRKDWKGKVSMAFYVLAIRLVFISPWIAGAFYIIVAGIWLVPVKRIESKITDGICIFGSRKYYKKARTDWKFDSRFSVFSKSKSQLHRSALSGAFLNNRYKAISIR